MVWLKQQKFVPHHSGGSKSKIKVSAGFISPEASLLRLAEDCFLLSSDSLLNIVCF